jgi:predicted transcriptional regulator
MNLKINGLEKEREVQGAACMGIRFGPKLKKELQKLAKEQERSVSYVVRMLIIEALASRNRA